jgi:hypothetical protein
MLNYQIQRTDEQVRIVINRCGRATVKIYALISGMILYCSYFAWGDREKLNAGDPGLWGFLLIGVTILLFLFHQLWKLIKPDVWVIKRDKGRIEHNGVLTGLASEMEQVLVRHESDTDHDDEYTAYIVPRRGKPITVGWGYGDEGRTVDEIAQYIAESARLRLVRESR